jgi:hypothetical protein
MFEDKPPRNWAGGPHRRAAGDLPLTRKSNRPDGDAHAEVRGCSRAFAVGGGGCRCCHRCCQTHVRWPRSATWLVRRPRYAPSEPTDLQSADDVASATLLTWARITRPVVLRQGHPAHIPRRSDGGHRPPPSAPGDATSQVAARVTPSMIVRTYDVDRLPYARVPGRGSAIPHLTFILYHESPRASLTT